MRYTRDPGLTALEERRTVLRQSIDLVMARAEGADRDLTDDEHAEVTRLAGALDEADRQLDDGLAAEHRAVATGELAHQLDVGHAPDQLVYPFAPTRTQLAQLRSAIDRRESFRVVQDAAPVEHLRAAVTYANVGGPVAGGYGRLPEPRRLSVVVGLVPEGTDSGGVSGPRFGQPSAAAPTPEGTTKPEADDVTKLDIVPQALARWTDTTRHAVLSQASYLDQLASWHALFLAKDEDRLIIAALAAAAGDPIDGTADPAAGVRTAIATVSDAASADADLVVVNPADYAAVATFAPNSGGAVESWAARVGPAVVYPSSSQTVGTALVAAVRAGGRLVQTGATETTGVEDVKTNVLTVRTEAFVGFGVRLAGSVRAVTLTV
jgi:hypothetical protein